VSGLPILYIAIAGGAVVLIIAAVIGIVLSRHSKTSSKNSEYSVSQEFRTESTWTAVNGTEEYFPNDSDDDPPEAIQTQLNLADDGAESIESGTLLHEFL
jgi:hypothetical protein